MTDTPAYGLWTLVALNTVVFVVFAYSFAKPRTGRDWRSLGAFSAFLLALFTEMYGFPLTVYVLAGWLQSRYPDLDILSHNSGHLWEALLGTTGDPHLSPLHLASNLLIAGGFVLLASSWKVLYAAQIAGHLAVTGPYARIRHPQYVAFLMILFGFLLQWPTVLTLVMFPVLAVMYVRLARAEERDALGRFGDAYARYAAETPAFLVRLAARAPAAGDDLDDGSAQTRQQQSSSSS